MYFIAHVCRLLEGIKDGTLVSRNFSANIGEEPVRDEIRGASHLHKHDALHGGTGILQLFAGLAYIETDQQVSGIFMTRCPAR